MAVKRFSSWAGCFCGYKDYADILKMDRNSICYLGHLSSNDLDKEQHKF